MLDMLIRKLLLFIMTKVAETLIFSVYPYELQLANLIKW